MPSWTIKRFHSLYDGTLHPITQVLRAIFFKFKSLLMFGFQDLFLLKLMAFLSSFQEAQQELQQCKDTIKANRRDPRQKL